MEEAQSGDLVPPASREAGGTEGSSAENSRTGFQDEVPRPRSGGKPRAPRPHVSFGVAGAASDIIPEGVVIPLPGGATKTSAPPLLSTPRGSATSTSAVPVLRSPRGVQTSTSTSAAPVYTIPRRPAPSSDSRIPLTSEEEGRAAGARAASSQLLGQGKGSFKGGSVSFLIEESEGEAILTQREPHEGSGIEAEAETVREDELSIEERKEAARAMWRSLLNRLPSGGSSRSSAGPLTPSQQRWATLRSRLPEAVRKTKEGLRTPSSSLRRPTSPVASPPPEGGAKKAWGLLTSKLKKEDKGEQPAMNAVPSMGSDAGSMGRQPLSPPFRPSPFPRAGSTSGPNGPSMKRVSASVMLPGAGAGILRGGGAGGAVPPRVVFPKSDTTDSKEGEPSAFPFLPKISAGVAKSEMPKQRVGVTEVTRRKPGGGGGNRGQSVLLCMDPNCNSCPPEMHAHRHMSKTPAIPEAPKKKRFNLKDLEDLEDDEEDEDEEGERTRVVISVSCCGYKLSFARPSIPRIMPAVFNPHNAAVKIWAQVLLYLSLFTFILDPLFLFAISFNYEWACAYSKYNFLYALVAIRSVVDLFTLANMVLYSRLAFKATQADVRQACIRNKWGELVKVGELVVDDRRAIFRHYCSNFLALDLLNLIPWPQILYLAILPRLPTIDVANGWIVLLRLSVLLQCVPRFLRVLPVISGTSGYVLMESAWSTFLLNLFSFSMASHILGALWFLLVEQRVAECLEFVCSSSSGACSESYLSCPSSPPTGVAQIKWINSGMGTGCFDGQNPPPSFQYGIYENGVQAVFLDSWLNQWLYSIMWGFQQISTFGGNLVATTNVGEVVFLLLLVSLGLFLFALLIGNMQNFLQALSRRMMEHQLHMRDLKKWLSRSDMPKDIQKRIRTLERYVWTSKEGVEEESVLASLTEDIQRDVRRHLFLQPIRKCHLLAVMDTTVQDAICERLKSRQYIDGTEIIREGVPVSRMFFVLRGALESIATHQGRTGFFERVVLQKGDFFGEELLIYFIEKYAGEKRSGKRRSIRRDIKFTSSILRDALPRSERTVRCLGPVDGFSLDAEDIDYVCTQFYKDMQGEPVQRALDLCSKSRQTRAATTIQVWYRATLRRRLDIPFDVFVQAVRTRRLGMLIRNASLDEGLLDVLPKRNRRTQSKVAERNEDYPSTPRKSSRKVVSWFATSSRENSANYGEVKHQSPQLSLLKTLTRRSNSEAEEDGVPGAPSAPLGLFARMLTKLPQSKRMSREAHGGNDSGDDASQGSDHAQDSLERELAAVV